MESVKTKKEVSIEQVSPARKTRKIQLEVWEDAEATFYLMLAKIINTPAPDPVAVKSFLDCICYCEGVLAGDRGEDLTGWLKEPWKYIHDAAKHNRGLYIHVCLDTFEDFIRSEFARSVLDAYIMLNDLRTAAVDSENVLLKTKLSLHSLIINAFREPLQKSAELKINMPKPLEAQLTEMECQPRTDGGWLVRANGEEHEMEVYGMSDGKLQKVLFFDGEQEWTYTEVYVRMDGDICKIEIDRDLNAMTFHLLPGATIQSGELDLSHAKEPITLPLTGEFLSQLQMGREENGTITFGFPHVEVKNHTETDYDFAPFERIEIDKELADKFRVPDNVKKESYLRQRIVTGIFEVVNQYFPDLSAHVKCTITGYLCIPFHIFDTEQQHEDSPRVCSYHAYVRKTVMNIINSKP